MKRLAAAFLLLPCCLSAAPEAQTWFPAGQALALDQAGSGARAMALGSAFTAIADDNSALAWNPAGLAGIRTASIGLHHNSWLGGINQESSDLVIPSKTWGGLGLSENYIDYGSFEGRDASGNPSENFSAQRLGLGLGWGSPVSQDFDIGVALRAGRQFIASASYDSLEGSVGALYRPFPGLQVGSSYNNIGNSGSGSPLASGLLLGASMKGRMQSLRMLLASGFTLEPSGVNRLQLGAELSYASLSARAGYLASLQDNAWGGINSMTLGCGFNIASLNLDYAWLPFGDLGSSQRLSLSYAFTGSAPPIPVITAPAAMRAYAESVSLSAALPPPPGPAQVEAPQGADSFTVLSEGYMLGQDLEGQGKIRQALTAYQLAIAGDSADKASWKALAKLYVQLGHNDYAKTCYLRVMKLDAQDAEAGAWLRENSK